jgi:multidrug efflux pump subunit AcrB
VRRSSLDLPGGRIKTDGGEVLLRTKGQAYWGAEFEELVVLTRPDGSRVLLSDVATVVDGFEDIDLEATFDGEPTATIRVSRVGKQDILYIANAVREYVANANLPEGIKLTLWRDQSVELANRRDTMIRNGRMGYVLVLIVLAIFLKARLAFWVSMGVPISFMGAFWMLPFFGLTINAISLFALILVLGILVDDAIVVGENVYTHQQHGEDPLASAITGTQEVSVPVIFGVLTTVVAFAPMLVIGGRMGQIFGVIAGVVILCLFFSLIESQLVLPAHLGHGAGNKNEEHRGVAAFWKRLQGRFGAAFERFTHERYAVWLARATHWRYTTVAIGLALLFCAVAMVRSGRMNFSFFPDLQANYVSARIAMPQGTPVETTKFGMQQLLDAVAELRAELETASEHPEGSLIKHVMATVGQQPMRAAQSENPAEAGSIAAGGSHLGEVTIELIAAEQRAISAETIADRWRELAGPVAGVDELTFASALFSIGDAMNFQLQGYDVATLQEAADRIKAKLAGYPGTSEISDSFRAGKREIKLAIKPEAEALGLGLRDLARQVRQAFYGEEAQRIQRGRDDVRVMVRYPESQRRSLGDLEDMRIRTPNGSEVPFASVAEAHLGRGFSTIRRADRQRVINVIGDVDRNLMTSNEIIADMEAGPLPEILADYPGVTYRLEGMQREQQRAFGALARWYVVGLFGIYALLAIPLRSYGQPLIIMSVIPFGLVGAISGHVFMGLVVNPNLGNLSFMSIIGMVALTGVVVNSSLVLVHYVNGVRKQGLEIVEAVHRAGVARLRPIVLTALTTFVGLTPLLLERSVQAQFLIPMATSLAFGVLFASLITLFIVPSGYLILEDLRSFFTRGRTRERRGVQAHDGAARAM